MPSCFARLWYIPESDGLGLILARAAQEPILGFTFRIPRLGPSLHLDATGSVIWVLGRTGSYFGMATAASVGGTDPGGA